MTLSEEQQLAVLFERLDNLIKTFQGYAEEDRKRHMDNENALAAHIAMTLPIINDHFAMRGEFTMMKAAQWLLAGGLMTVIAGLAIAIIGKR